MNLLSREQSITLDFIRGISALLVFGGHLAPGVSEPIAAFIKFAPLESLAVVIFFWLSGFIIVYNTLTKRNYTAGGYFIDRLTRIYPIFIFTIILCIAMQYCYGHGGGGGAMHIMANTLMLAYTPFSRIFSFLPDTPRLYMNSSSWSLMVEWWLYMGWMIIFFWGKSGKGVRVILAIISVPSILVVGYFTMYEYGGLMWIYGGVCAALFVKFIPRVSLSIFCLVLAVIGIIVRFTALAKAPVINMYDMQLSIFFTLFLYGFISLSARINFTGWFIRLSKFLAFVSYTLFLVHLPLNGLVANVLIKFTNDGVIIRWWSIIIVFTLAVAIAFLLENRQYPLRRFIKVKLERIQARRQSSAV